MNVGTQYKSTVPSVSSNNGAASQSFACRWRLAACNSSLISSSSNTPEMRRKMLGNESDVDVCQTYRMVRHASAHNHLQTVLRSLTSGLVNVNEDAIAQSMIVSAL